VKRIILLASIGLAACAVNSRESASAQLEATDANKKAAEVGDSISDKSRAAGPMPVAPIVDDVDDLDAERQAGFVEAMRKADDRARVFQASTPVIALDGDFAQGGVLFGATLPDATVKLDGKPVMVGEDGRFVIGFGRDSKLIRILTASFPDGSSERRSIELEDRVFKIDRIDGIDQSKVSGFTEEQLVKIGKDKAKKTAARATTENNAAWKGGFEWPVTGRISGVFGSQRILNGEEKRPHSGVDVAVPTGTPILAPAAGIVRLAESDMYFEGGLVFLDHGLWLESAFLHMSRVDVKPGQWVEKGDVIGAVGATGRVTGPHLHWSLKWAGTLVDPQLLAGEMKNKPADSASN